MKEAPAEKVVEAIRRVLGGSLYLSEAIGDRLLHIFLNGRSSRTGTSPVDQLSDREVEVFRALGNGKNTREIAWSLHLSVKTVETHRANLKKKLNLQTANELIRVAVEWVNSDGKAYRLSQ